LRIWPILGRIRIQLPALEAGVAQAGKMLGLQVLARARQVAANLVAEAAALAALNFGAIRPHGLLQEVKSNLDRVKKTQINISSRKTDFFRHSDLPFS